MCYTTATPSSIRSNTFTKARIVAPNLSHGAHMWRIAKDSVELDLNSSYMYLLFAKDFSSSSRVALVDDEVVGFVLAYRRSEDPACLFVWQIAVSQKYQGNGLAGRLLDDLIDSSAKDEQPIRSIETTITQDNLASLRLFQGLADRWETGMHTRSLFDESDFPDEHEAERLHLIGPFDPLSGAR